MELFRDTHIDFMKYRRFWIILSFLLVLGGLYAILGPHRLNMGIDFAGGTQITLGFNQTPNLDRVRQVLEREGMKAPEIQRYGKPEENELMVKTTAIKGNEEGNRDKMIAALSREFNPGQTGFDLNQASTDAIAALLLSADPDKVAAQGPDAARAHYTDVAAAIVRDRSHNSLFRDFSRIAKLPGVSP